MPGKILPLRYLPAAQEDLLALLDWIARGSPSRAVLSLDRLDQRIARLERQPHLERVPRNAKLRAYGYRVLVVESYLVFYVIRSRSIEIHRVVHGSRDLDALV
jgi:plasmid stabilization system protein ParE